MHLLNDNVPKWFLTICLFLGMSDFSYSMSRPQAEPVVTEFVRVVYDKDAKAIVTEWVIPSIDTIENLSRIELLISHVNNGPKFAVMQNRSDRTDPIPPGNFGVIIDPASDDRSIKNVSSAGGIPGRFDYISPHGSLLKQSASGVVNGNLGISIWIAPKNWDPGRYTIKTRVGKRKYKPSPWQKLATFVYSENDVKQVTQNQGLVKPIFIDITNQKPLSQNWGVSKVTLIRYERQKQDEGVTMKRWAGDTSGQYKYVEKEKRKLDLVDFPGGFIPLKPGLYLIKHNSVRGTSGMTSGFYGKSNFFEVKAESEVIEVRVSLYPAI